MNLDNWLNIIGIIISSILAIITFHISRRLSAKDKFDHEMNITKKMREIPIYSSIILADVSKYNPARTDQYNRTYYKQGAEIYTIIPEFGLQVILMPKIEGEIPMGVIPFEWIDYIRDYDSEDNKYIIVCKFKGIRYFKCFRSPFKEINSFYKNEYYKDGDREFSRYIGTKSSLNK